ncbi:hypothetical protein LCGC14_0147340 [marine sediment metagenome]|uniref:PD-(D/E)XK endonuclease-like domain-containing protein n=1 Tax=marine sediment metagenome TaxID=412755 RepID=A0A0F9VFQ6_9ZZZZ
MSKALRKAVRNRSKRKLVGFTDEALEIVSNLDKALLKDVEEKSIKHKRRTGVFHPSEIGSMYPCNRRLYYSYLDAPRINRFSPQLHRIFRNGHTVHDRLQYLFGKAYPGNFEAEVPVSVKEYEIFGHADGVLTTKVGTFVIEIKSAASGSLASLTKPKLFHERQATCYAKGLGLNRILFLYENKDNQTLIPLFVNVSDITWGSVEKLINSVKSDIEKGVLPLVNKGSWCTTCAFLTQCKQDNKEG